MLCTLNGEHWYIITALPDITYFRVDTFNWPREAECRRSAVEDEDIVGSEMTDAGMCAEKRETETPRVYITF